jgi:hypothetical protein
MAVRRFLTLFLIVGAASIAAGCEPSGTTRAPAFAERAALRERDLQLAALAWQNAALAYELQLRNANLREAATAVAFVKKLEELMALNSELSSRLAKAEKALETIAADQNPGSARGQLDEMRMLRQASEERVEAYRQLIRGFQALVDSGRIQATLRDGRVHFEIPRPIDQASPWN